MVRDTGADAHESEWASCIRAGQLLGPLGSTAAGREARLISFSYPTCFSPQRSVFPIKEFFCIFLHEK